jgi:hypothetical protein
MRSFCDRPGDAEVIRQSTSFLLPENSPIPGPFRLYAPNVAGSSALGRQRCKIPGLTGPLNVDFAPRLTSTAKGIFMQPEWTDGRRTRATSQSDSARANMVHGRTLTWLLVGVGVFIRLRSMPAIAPAWMKDSAEN